MSGATSRKDPAPTFNGNSTFSNSNSFFFGASDPEVRSLPLTMRYGIPGFEAGWPAR